MFDVLLNVIFVFCSLDTTKNETSYFCVFFTNKPLITTYQMCHLQNKLVTWGTAQLHKRVCMCVCMYITTCAVKCELISSATLLSWISVCEIHFPCFIVGMLVIPGPHPVLQYFQTSLSWERRPFTWHSAWTSPLEVPFSTSQPTKAKLYCTGTFDRICQEK